MKNLSTLVLGASLLSTCVVTPAMANARTSAIQFDRTSIDLNKVYRGQTVICEFKFKNRSNAPVRVSDVERVCGAPVVSWNRRSLAPGEEGSIKIGFSSTKELGEFRRPVVIKTSSNGETQEMYLFFKGEVIAAAQKEDARLAIRDSKIAFKKLQEENLADEKQLRAESPQMYIARRTQSVGTIQEGEQVTTHYEFVNKGSQPLTITDVRVGDELKNFARVEYPKQPVAPGEKGTIDVVYNPTGKKIGENTDALAIQSNDYMNNNYLVLFKSRVRKAVKTAFARRKQNVDVDQK
jgi:hypothetical protein